MSTPIVFEVEVDNLAAAIELDSNQVNVTPTDPTVVFGVTPGPRGLRGPAGDGAQVFGESPTGVMDGANLTFTLANSYQPGSTAVYLNGLREFDGYTETTPTTITFEDPPQSTDSIRVDYIIQ